MDSGERSPVRQLRGADANFLQQETSDLHTMKLVIVDPATVTEVIDMEGVRRWAATTLLRIAPFRWRLASSPLGIGRPFWVDGPVVVTEHLCHAVIPEPGGAVELDDLVSEIVSTPMSRDRPLWQLWFVEGLSGGRVGFLLKCHHALGDGLAMDRALEEMFGARPLPATTDGEVGEPSRAALIARSVQGQVSAALRAPSMLWRTANFLRQERLPTHQGAALARPYAAPMTLFNQPLTPRRVYVSTSIPLASVRGIRAAAGGSSAEIFVTLCAGTIRRYLSEHGDLPAESLTACLPATVRKSREDVGYENAVAWWYIPLATDVEDPSMRLHRIQESFLASRQRMDIDAELFRDWEDYGLLHRLRRRGRSRLEGDLRPIANVGISTVHGPKPLSYQGAEAVAVSSVGLVASGVSITAKIYREQVFVGFLGCPVRVPEARRLADHLVAELAVMTEATGAAGAAGSSGDVPSSES
jgi:WS/DGAT/MGAT family acyltransferase